MAEIIQCPQCRQQLRVPDALLGKRVQCPACSYVFLSPCADSGTPVEMAELAEEVAEPQPARQRARPRDEEDEDFDDWDEEPRYRRRRDLPEHRGGLILALGICSLLFGCLGLILGPIAWAMGNNDLAAMRSGRLDPDGESLTTAGRICGIIGTVVGGFGFCIGLLWLLVMMTAVANGPAPRAWP